MFYQLLCLVLWHISLYKAHGSIRYEYSGTRGEELVNVSMEPAMFQLSLPSFHSHTDVSRISISHLPHDYSQVNVSLKASSTSVVVFKRPDGTVVVLSRGFDQQLSGDDFVIRAFIIEVNKQASDLDRQNMLDYYLNRVLSNIEVSLVAEATYSDIVTCTITFDGKRTQGSDIGLALSQDPWDFGLASNARIYYLSQFLPRPCESLLDEVSAFRVEGDPVLPQSSIQDDFKPSDGHSTSSTINGDCDGAFNNDSPWFSHHPTAFDLKESGSCFKAQPNAQVVLETAKIKGKSATFRDSLLNDDHVYSVFNGAL